MKRNKEKEAREKVAEKFFSHERRALYDIMPRGKMPDVVVREEDDEEEDKAPAVDSTAIKSRKLNLADDRKNFVDTDFEKPKHFRRRGRRFWITLLVILVAVIGTVAYAYFVLPEASIEITLQQKPYEYHDNLTASLSDTKLPLQVFTETKDLIYPFPASGNKNVSRKAHGALNVCNAYNSSPQPLVVTTRFSTPDNIIFRLDEGITVPGATIVGGKIQPNCIDVKVTADKAGVESNIGPVTRWLIPGLKGSPKYDAFYAKSDKAMAGGIIGGAKVALAADIVKAKTAAREQIKAALDVDSKVRLPSGLIIANDSNSTSTSFVIIKEAVIDATDANGNAQYYIEARSELVALREKDVEAVIGTKAQSELGPDYTLSEGVPALNLAGKTRDSHGAISSANIAVDFSGGFVQQLAEAEVRTQTAGKTEAELRNFMPTHKDFKAHITLWPFWVQTIPENQDKIKVSIKTEPLNSSSSDALSSGPGRPKSSPSNP